MAHQKKNRGLEEINSIIDELIDILKYPIHQPRFTFRTCGRSCEILSINKSENKTIIQMQYYAQPRSDGEDFVNIDPRTFIRHSDTDETLSMIQAVNIPISPKKHDFKHHLESLSFELIFPTIPMHWKKIDLIEKEPGDASNFNFYGINVNPLHE